MPSWIVWLLKPFASPAIEAAAPPSLSELASSSTVTTIEDVLGIISEAGIPWASTAENLLTVGVMMVNAGLVTPGQEYPDGEKHEK